MMEFIVTLPLLYIHLTAIACTLALVVTADIHGFLWLVGKIGTLPKKRMRRIHLLIWIGLSIIIVSGFCMFLTYKDYLLVLPAFKLKMFFVATLLINAFVIGKLAHIAYFKPFSALPASKRTPLLVSGFVSTMSWIGALIAAQFLGL